MFFNMSRQVFTILVITGLGKQYVYPGCALLLFAWTLSFGHFLGACFQTKNPYLVVIPSEDHFSYLS